MRLLTLLLRSRLLLRWSWPLLRYLPLLRWSRTLLRWSRPALNRSRPLLVRVGIAVARGLVRAASRNPTVRRYVLHPGFVRAGYLAATAAGLVWGGVLSTGPLERRAVVVASGCPPWSFGRGGTTVGAVYLTRDLVSDSVIAHEAVHRDQWRRYGLAFIPLYFAAGLDPRRNRFEIEAGLAAGGYR